MPGTPGGTTSLRYIDTTGLPEGFDVGDLIAQGTTGDDLIAWCKARVRPGLPPTDRPAPVDQTLPPTRQRKSPDTAGGNAGAPGAVGEARTETKGATRSVTASTAQDAAGATLVATAANVAALPVQRPQAPPEADEMMLPPEYSDDSLAREFTRQYGQSFLYVNTWGRWLQWDGCRWKHDVTMRAQHAARMVLREQANQILDRQFEFKAKARGMATAVSSARTISNVERIARTDPKHAAASEQFDADPWLLNTPNGVVDLRTGQIRHATMADYCTKVTRVAPDGDCQTWLRFLNDVTDGDVEMQKYLQRVAGYALTGSTREHALFFFYGTGRNGKGTFLNTLEWIMGDYSRVASMEVFTESKNERHPTELAALMGARLVTSQETDEGKRWAEARIKSMTGGDPITARFMRMDEFTYAPQFKLMISGNHRPGLRNVDEAMKARLHLVPFTITVPVEKRDPLLAEKLKSEAGGILAWAIAGCREWDRIRLSPPLAVRKATDEYFGSQDVVGQWLADECEVGPSNRGPSGDLYRSFEKYCAQAGEFTLPRRRWMDALELKGIKLGRSSAGRFMQNVRLKPRGNDMPDEEPLL